jgi:capsule polysaccharide export protein KpsE/RkpR
MPDLNILAKINEVLKQYHTIDLQLKMAAETTSLLKTEFVAIRTELLELKAKVAALEEARNTLQAEMERMKAEAVAELRAIKAETVAELKVQQAQYEADLYRKVVDTLAALDKGRPVGETPQIEQPKPRDS